jgi:superfamily II DNA or RNA helicase
MNNLWKEKFKKSLETGFMEKSTHSEFLYQPELLTNHKKPPRKVLTTLLREFHSCQEFYISVAFVTTSGVATLINTFKTLEKKGVTGKVIVSQYLNFTQPEALKKLSRLSNIKLRIATKENAHSKGYLFKTPEYFNLIIGSSNLTANALTINKEWNLKVSALHSSAIVEKVLKEFELDFEEGSEVTTEYLEKYQRIYNEQLLFNRKIREEGLLTRFAEIAPNSMQIDALKKLKILREKKKSKALLISATGTGKTYLSAFDAKSLNPKKLLFVVHRLNIAEKSLQAFKHIFGSQKTMGLYSGNKRELNNDFIFSTIQTISKDSHLNQFSHTHFEYIIIDESHRSGANSYRKLLDYFKPNFLLGMTATPERTDGYDIFSLFDHNIAFEIRLNRAMEEGMLSQFHYYGIADITIDNETFNKKRDFNLLLSDERVKRIIQNATFYGCDNGIIRGLVFCSRNDEANELSIQFNERGLKTVALTGNSSEEERVNAIERLESDDLEKKLDYIFTVDIFNEGIDIPKVNQIIMIRPTESAIIFVQQLGRGLRKIESKRYLTVIDFIGNYKNNYLIPIALYGDTSYNKDSLRKMITEGSTMIPGASTVNFDEITKEKIFQSIDSANMHQFSDLKKDYLLLKYKLGHSPLMMDFINHGSRDPFLYVNYAKSLFNFARKIDPDSIPEIPGISKKILEVFSREINNSIRVEESIILLNVIEKGAFSLDELCQIIKTKYGYTVTEDTVESCVRNLNFAFIRDKKNKKLLSVKDIYDIENLIYKDGIFYICNKFRDMLNQTVFKKYLMDSIQYSICTFDNHFEWEKWNQGFVLYRKYSRKDVFRILNVKENPVAQNVGGYLVDTHAGHCPIFVNYHKEDDISESTKYDDEFINKTTFDWMSKSKRTLNSPDVQAILGENGAIRLLLFIKKNNDEGQEFYYMGDVSPKSNEVKPAIICEEKY